MFQAHSISKEYPPDDVILFRPARMKLDRLVRVHLFMWYHQADQITLSEIGRAFGKESTDDWGKILCDRVKQLRPICRAARVGGPMVEEYPADAEPHVYHNDRHRVYAMADLKTALHVYRWDARAWFTARILWWAKLNKRQIAMRTGSAEGLYDRIAKMTGRALATLAQSLYDGTEPMDGDIREVRERILRLGPGGWSALLQPFGDVIEYIRFHGRADVGPIPEIEEDHAEPEPASAESSGDGTKPKEPGKTASAESGDRVREVADSRRVIRLLKIPRWAMIAAAVAVCFVGLAAGIKYFSWFEIEQAQNDLGPEAASQLPIDPDDPQARLRHANTLYATGDCEAARREIFLIKADFDNEKLMADCDYLLGMIYHHLGQIKRAEQSFSIAMDFYSQRGLKIAQYLTGVEIAKLHISKGELDLASKEINQAQSNYEKTTNPGKDTYYFSYFEAAIHLAYQQKDYERALSLSKERFLYFELTGLMRAYALSDVALSLALNGEIQPAKAFFTKAETIFKNIGSERDLKFGQAYKVVLLECEGKDTTNLTQNIADYAQKAQNFHLQSFLSLTQELACLKRIY